jgi:hypothetical protein
MCSRLLGVATGVLLAVASGCSVGTLLTIPYSPRPEQVAAPDKVLEEMLQTVRPTPLKVEVTDAYFMTVQDDGRGSARTGVLQFANVADFKIGHPDPDDWPKEGMFADLPPYWVSIYDPSGVLIYYFEAADLAMAQRFIDAVAAKKRALKKP